MIKKENSRALLWTVLLIAFIQMANLAILPGVDHIATQVFPERPLKDIQMAMALPNIVVLISGVLAAILERTGLISKKALVIVGLVFCALTGVSALIFHTHFWHLHLMNTILGVGMGLYVQNYQSIIYDSFDEKKRQFISGVQSSCSHGGGILLSILAGYLVTIVWYGGHLVSLIIIPIAVVSFFAIPADKKARPSPENRTIRTKLPSGVYYHSVLVMVFMVIYNVAGMNISTHIANGSIGNAATSGIATACLMAGGVVGGLVFPKVSPFLRDNIFSFSLTLIAIGFSLMNIFSTSLIVILASMAICGASFCLYIPRCIFNVSNITDPSNSATATMLLVSVAAGIGSYLSPLIMTNLTLLLGGDSTQFRYQFTAFVCLAMAVILFVRSRQETKRTVSS